MIDLSEVTIAIKSFLRPCTLDACIYSIRKFYPDIGIHVADDGNMNKAPLGVNRLYQLPFDSGVSIGRNFLVEVKYKF